MSEIAILIVYIWCVLSVLYILGRIVIECFRWALLKVLDYYGFYECGRTSRDH